jgi:hypothetical protein
MTDYKVWADARFRERERRYGSRRETNNLLANLLQLKRREDQFHRLDVLIARAQTEPRLFRRLASLLARERDKAQPRLTAHIRSTSPAERDTALVAELTDLLERIAYMQRVLDDAIRRYRRDYNSRE